MSQKNIVNQKMFSALKEDGRVITWGGDNNGAEGVSLSDSVKDTIYPDLKNIKEIYYTDDAYAALQDDGTENGTYKVITWGQGSYGGDSSSVASDLTSGVTKLYASHRAFAAIKTDGSVITWGDSNYGGDSSSVASDLTSDVKDICVISIIYFFYI